VNNLEIFPVYTGRVIWITGLSGAGKSTLANEIVHKLRARGFPTVMLDGDVLRDVFGVDPGNSENHVRDRRLSLAKQYAHLCQVVASQGLTVVIATISLFREIHDWNRVNLPGYYEVYLNVPLDELKRRDSKGIYSRFDAGILKCVAGLDIPVDEPIASDWVVNFSPECSASVVAENLLTRFLRKD